MKIRKWTSVSRVTDDQLTKLVEEERPSLIQELGVYTILFNCRQEQLADPQVRGALVLSLGPGRHCRGSRGDRPGSGELYCSWRSRK